MSVDSRFTFPKRERLVSRKLIEQLFGGSGSRSMAAFPLRAVYQIKKRTPHEASIQLLISVPKKRFHHAVDRNRVKRQVREAFRHHQQVLCAAMPDDSQLLLAFVWLSDSHSPSCDVESRVANLLRRIAEKV